MQQTLISQMKRHYRPLLATFWWLITLKSTEQYMAVISRRPIMLLFYVPIQ